MTNVASAPTGMRLKTIATLFAVSAVILTGSPAFATPVSHHETHGQNQFCGAFAGCSPRDIGLQRSNSGNEVPDHWPNNLLLG
jgi:hypothetical protein